LVVEDDESARMLLSDYLRDNGFPVVVAEDGEEALKVAALHHPRLVVMDIRMPRMDGLTAIASLRAQGIATETPIIALTALSRPEDEARCIQAGADLFLTKPIDLRKLLTEIHDLVD
jgi:CheY-like chemotaxis protein